MPNLSAIKEKLEGLKVKLLDKADKIGFIKKWREKAAAKKTAAPAGSDPLSLANIYREGSTGTRLQVLAFYIFVLVALMSAGSLVIKVVGKLRSSTANEQMKKEYAHQIAEVQRKAIEKADLVSLGQFTANAYVGSARDTMMMNVDLWVRVIDPDTAALISDRNELFRDRTINVLNELFHERINLLTVEGKDIAREKIKAALNRELNKAGVEEIFIENLIVQ